VLAADTLEKIRPEAARLKVRVAEDDRWEDVVLRMMAEHIEPHLGLGRPCFLTDYPIAMAALARPKPNDPRLAERFELYVCGVELANAFVELTDAEAQRTRLVADNALRKKLYGVDAQLDGDFLDALQHGMPQAAGIALGVDRLVMLATGAEDIADVVWQPVGD
ncbi:MAG TPA: amino acid--tRNA ligase-related protein, partial [Alphaproteobacteria bacterium]|nr:amino acid--tRNA ligase-related protein [Alphaproteobacteria bacterium]